MAELFVRPGWNDHHVVANLLAASSGPFGDQALPLNVLVVDATTAMKQPMFAEKANHAGVPFLVDPMTPFAQDEQTPDDPWVKLPYGRPEAASPEDLVSSSGSLTATGMRLLDQCVEFQIDNGATSVIAPYFFIRNDTDGWTSVQTAMWNAVRELGLTQPVMPIIALNLLGAGQPAQSDRTITPLLDALRDFGDARQAGLALSWGSPGGDKDGVDRLQRVFEITRLVARAGPDVIAWRQGIYGLALTAAGAAGYETGIGTGERCDIGGQLSRRRPTDRPKPSGGPGAGGVYLELLHRSVTHKQANALFDAPGLAGQLVCTTGGRCCADGTRSMLSDSRPHAVRTRAHQLRQLDAISNPQWRLNQIARDAERGSNLAVQVNRVLRQNSLNLVAAAPGLAAIAEVADRLRENGHNAVA